MRELSEAKPEEGVGSERDFPQAEIGIENPVDAD